MEKIFIYYILPPAIVAGAGLLILLIILFVLILFSASKLTRYKTIAVGVSVVFSIAFAEFILRATGTYATYMEKRTEFYWSPYDYNRNNTLWNRDSGQAYILRSSEFSYPRKANSFGFVDKEFTTKKEPNEVKVLCLGDSFVEGDGAPEDSCYPRQLEKILQHRWPQKKITVMNAGICGSDPVFGYKIYDSLMYRFNPDIVIQLVTKQDFNEDIAFRGGFERFMGNGQLEFKRKFKYEDIYRLSFLSRIYFTGLMGYNFLFINNSFIAENQNFFEQQACMIGQKWDAALAQRNFKLYFVVKPDIWDITHNYDYRFENIVKALDSCSNKAAIIDVRNYYVDSSKMQENINRFFWPIDGHHTSQGYYEMARAIALQINLEP